MSMAARPVTQSPALHVADMDDLIRVHGARENYLKAVNVELPKRGLTMFTGAVHRLDHSRPGSPKRSTQ
jgi:hypothetical protein